MSMRSCEIIWQEERERLCTCWLPNVHLYSTDNDFWNTSNVIHTGTIIFHGNTISSNAAKLGLPYQNTYNTSNVILKNH